MPGIRPLKSKPFKIASRASHLAVAQVFEVIALLKKRGILLNYQHQTYHTAGDHDKKTPLTDQVADDFFTNTIDQAILAHAADVAIHSAKDLPQSLHPDLEIIALTPCLDETDAWVGAVPLEDLPPGAKIGTSSFLRQASIKALRPDLTLVNIRGTIQERLSLIDQKTIDGIIVATCALKRLKLDHLIKGILPWEGTPLQGQLAIVGRRGDQTTHDNFQKLDVRNVYGKVSLIGAGPGDPDLITVKAVEILKRSDCVFYDFLVDPVLLKHAPKAEHIYVGKRKGAHSLDQQELSRLIRIKAQQGKKVVRLKGGDPLIFGRGADELAYLRSFHIQTQVIPGVSSATGIPSLLGIPLTARGISSSVSFISAHHDVDSPTGSPFINIPNTQTIVIFMGLSKLTDIVRSLIKNNWSISTPIAVISRGTRRDQQVVIADLATIDIRVSESNIKPPALIIIGDTVRLYKPVVRNKKILFLGTHPLEYRDLGELIHWPMIQIRPRKYSAKEKSLIRSHLSRAELILFTSEYAVEHFFNLLTEFGKDISSVNRIDLAAIGSYTAQALLDRGGHPKIIAPVETAEGFFKELKKKMKLKNKNILFPRSSLPNPFLGMALTKEGAQVFEFPVYENVKPAKRALPKQPIDTVVFTSPSTVTHFLKDYGKIPKSWEILCKGPVSLKMLQDYGYTGRILNT